MKYFSQLFINIFASKIYFKTSTLISLSSHVAGLLASILPRKVLYYHRVTLLVPEASRTLLEKYLLVLLVMPCQVVLVLNVQVIQLHVNLFYRLQQILVLQQLAIFQRQWFVLLRLREIKILYFLSYCLVKPFPWKSVCVCAQIQIFWRGKLAYLELENRLIPSVLLVENRYFAKRPAILFGNVCIFFFFHDFILRQIGVNPRCISISCINGGTVHSCSGVGGVCVGGGGLLRLANLIDEFAFLFHELFELVFEMGFEDEELFAFFVEVERELVLFLLVGSEGGWLEVFLSGIDEEWL